MKILKTVLIVIAVKPTGHYTCGLCAILRSNRNLMPRLEFKGQPSVSV